jgi:hypothetical protein
MLLLKDTIENLWRLMFFTAFIVHKFITNTLMNINVFLYLKYY